MVDRVERRTDLVAQQAISMLPDVTIRIDVTDCKPETQLFPFFDGERIDEYCTRVPSSSGMVTTMVQGGPFITDAAGRLQISFTIPANRFSTGQKVIELNETETPSGIVLGSTFGYARATFTSAGTALTYQETINNITVVINEIINRIPGRQIQKQPSEPPTNAAAGGLAPGADPLAQSFFTQDVDGGCFVTSIEIFVQSKDNNAPLIIELRKLINGVPDKKVLATEAIASVLPQNITTQNDASVATKFTFPKPIRLEQNEDYCFVVWTNSSKYHIWTNKLGEKTIETGAIAWKQPYIGSLFKSENAVTWNAEQFEDIKFKLNIAEFNTTASGELEFHLSTGSYPVSGKNFQVTTGSNIITFTSEFKHNLDLSSKITVQTENTANAINGVSFGVLNGDFVISELPDDYTVKFIVPGITPTATGELEISDSVQYLTIDNQGTGYTSTPTISFIGGGLPVGSGSGGAASCTVDTSTGEVVSIVVEAAGSGYTTAPVIHLVGGGGAGATATAAVSAGAITTITVTAGGSGYTQAPEIIIAGGASAVAVIRDNKLIHAILQNRGLGYTSTPTMQVTGGGGASATMSAYRATSLNVAHNVKLHNFKTEIPFAKFERTMFSQVFNFAEDYVMGAEEPFIINSPVNVGANCQIASSVNEDLFMGGTASGQIKFSMSSQNRNVSPVLDLSSPATVKTSHYVINNQDTDVITSTSASGAIVDIDVTTAGAGYSSIPTVTFVSTDGGTGATATAVLTSGAVSAINVTAGGTGYKNPPIVVLTGGSPSTPATAQAVLSTFNSELSPVYGNAESKYITKPINLESLQTGILLVATAYSNPLSSFEFYIKTSNSAAGENIHANEYIQLRCDVDRNQSSNRGQFVDYEFTADGLPAFDSYILKCVLRTETEYDPPIIDSYRVIMTA